MLGPELHKRIHNPDFRPYTIVLASGERIEVNHRDSVTLSSLELKGKRFFASSVQVLGTDGNDLIERIISLPMIAQIIDRYPASGTNGTNGVNGKH